MWEPVIGLEIHAQLLTKSKMFCSCSTDYLNAKPNENTCEVCLGYPGTLPVINEQAVIFAVKAAKALNCEIHEISRFDRKQYFYPDLPKGYQITQYFYPYATNGFLEFKGVKIRIRRIHMEEDSGKLFHENENIDSASYSVVNFNRAGIPLIEIVTEPDIPDPKYARIFVEKLRDILRFINVCDGNLENGSMRCDANISLRNTETGEFTSKVEVKNINSFKYIQNALEYEKERLLSLVENEEKIDPETRGWDSSKKLTISLRSKEGENDYRYFPEPDLPMLKIPDDIMNVEIEELPDQMISRFVKEYKISEYNANVLVSDKMVAKYFEKCVSLFNNPVLISNWIISEILRLKSSNEISLSPDNFTKLLSMVNDGKINNNTAKEILEEIYSKDLDPEDIIKKRGLSQINDTEELEKLVLKVIQDNSKEYEAYKNGKTKLFGFFVGQVMKITKGRANPKTVNKILRQKLDS